MGSPTRFWAQMLGCISAQAFLDGWNLQVFSAESHPGPMGESQVPALEMGGPEEISAHGALGGLPPKVDPNHCGGLA